MKKYKDKDTIEAHGAVIIYSQELRNAPVDELVKFLDEKQAKLKTLFGKESYEYTGSPLVCHYGHLFAFLISVWNKRVDVHFWDDQGGSSVYGWEGEVENTSEPLPAEVLKKINERLDEFNDGWIRCSHCGERIKRTEVAGHFYAGVYCSYCWEHGYKTRAANENYD